MNWQLKKKVHQHFQTQADFAQAVGDHEAKVSRVIRGRVELTPQQRARWAEILKCDEREVFGEPELAANKGWLDV